MSERATIAAPGAQAKWREARMPGIQSIFPSHSMSQVLSFSRALRCRSLKMSLTRRLPCIPKGNRRSPVRRWRITRVWLRMSVLKYAVRLSRAKRKFSSGFIISIFSGRGSCERSSKRVNRCSSMSVAVVVL